MKKNPFFEKIMKATCLMAVALCLPLTSCSSDDDDKLPSLADYLDIRITHCERVGSVLMIDYDLANKQDEELSLELFSPVVEDNVGKSYGDAMGVVALTLGGSSYYHRAESRISGKGKLSGHLKVKSFDPSDMAVTAKMRIDINIAGVTVRDEYLEQGASVADNRVKSHGVQTNDLGLTYAVTSCERSGDDVIMQFTMTNKTGQQLQEFGMGYTHGGIAVTTDNMGNSYDSDIRFGDGEWYHLAEANVNNGSSISGAIRVKNVKAGATELTIVIGATAQNYVVNDDQVRFLDIAIN